MKHPQVLNLNNEVVKMRKEVKRVRALIIRKLARQIAALKKKKGKDTEIERHQRRAARLLEEVHIMKSLPADQVTKTALQKNLNFDQVFKNPKSSLTDRAVARIATHQQFSKKIDDIKASVKAFGVERRKGGGKAKGQRATLESAKNQEEQEKSGSRAVELPEVADGKEEVEELKDISDRKAAKSEKKTEKRSDAESDAESAGGEEKEYFDDSTEERFYKQSSQSEDSEDDFFVGKVSKVKKRRKKPKMNEVEKEPEVNKDSSGGGDKLQRELDELESRLRPKTTTLQSVFCPSLARRKGGGGQEKRSLPGSNTRGFASSQRGVGRGRREAPRQQDPKAGGVFSSQPALHPSWEASRRRKEQQGQILAFQGKKIKFDDDDD
uniref:Serum response factor-binding protein 1 n=1 Tax=Oryzias latipes TaxID=8090 RepID=A0A3P9HIR0_ORYLA